MQKQKLINGNFLNEEHFEEIVSFFKWLQDIRNSNYTRKENIELTSYLQNSDNEIQESVEQI